MEVGLFFMPFFRTPFLRGSKPEMCIRDRSTAAQSVRLLTDLLYVYYGHKPIILLDEYDTPLQEAYFNSFWDEMVSFVGAFFNNSFKTNPSLGRALLTGITRICKESIFSDLNNIDVVTQTSTKYETAFGFTEEEVKVGLARVGLLDYREKVKEWYDGFTFGQRRDCLLYTSRCV